MFSRFATVLHNAVDALAPPIAPQEEFIYHWKAVTNFFIDKHSDSKAPIEFTNIPGHLEQMLNILTDEDCSAGATGPSMEYVLRHKLLDTLFTMGRADCPPGMKQYILQFFSKLLTRIHQPLLPHVNVHRPVQNLIKLCGEIKAAPTELEEIHFLCITCAKLKEAPHLVNFFLEIPKTTDLNNDVAKPINPQSCKFEFSLVTSLLSLCQSADSRVAVKACEGLLLCASLPEDEAAHCIVENTDFSNAITERLISLYKALPSSIDPNVIEMVEAKWGLDQLNFSEDIMMFPGKRQLVLFLSWLDYCDQLIKDAHLLVGTSLVRNIREKFLNEVFEPALLQESENEYILTLAHVMRCLRLVTSPLLAEEFVFFLLGNNQEPESPGIVVHPMKRHLLDRCDHPVNEVSIMTLKLFEVLIEKNSESALHNLVVVNLINREYYDNSAIDYQSSWSDEEDERIRRGSYENDISPGSSPISRTLAPSNIHRIINCFMMLLPDELKSCDLEEDMGYDNYLREAHRLFRDCAIACSSFDWPREAISAEERHHSDTSSSESQAEADSDWGFYEGSFLRMLFDKLENLLDQPYEISLQVTAIVSKLAVLPHPYLHEYLLNPLIPSPSGTRSLFTVLDKVVNEIQIRVLKIPQFKRRLYLTRKQLLGDTADATIGGDESDRFLGGIIVLEEFCKELAAFAFVKYHASS